MDCRPRLKRVRQLMLKHDVSWHEVEKFVDFEFLVENYTCAAILSVISQIKSTR